MTSQTKVCKLMSDTGELRDHAVHGQILVKPSCVLYILIGLWIFIKVFERSNYNIPFPEFSSKIFLISNVLRILFVAYFLINWMLQDKKILKITFFVLFGFFSVSSYILSNTFFIYDIFFIPLFLFGYLDCKKLFFVFFVSLLLAIATVISLDYFNILYSPIVNYRDGNIRYSYGFSHPNILGFMIVIFCICFVTVKKKFILLDLPVLLAASAFCYYYPNSFTSMFVICLIALFLLAARIFNFVLKYKIFKYLLFSLALLAFITTVYFVFFQTFTDSFRPFIEKMPGAIKGRFRFNMIAYDRYGLSLFGTPMRIILYYHIQVLGIREPYFTVDCAYFFALIQYGIVNLAAYLLTVVYCIAKSFKNNNLLGALLCLALAAYGISETVILSPLCMVAYAYCFYSNALPTPKVKRKRIIKVMA